MFLKKRHHADIMARLHSNNSNNTDNSISKEMEIMEDSDDSGFSSDLVIDEDYDETMVNANKAENMEQEEQKMKEEAESLKMMVEGSLKMDEEEKSVKERVSVIKHTCDLSTKMGGVKKKEKEQVFGEGCCSKMNSIIGKCISVKTPTHINFILFSEDCVYYDKKEKTCFCKNLFIGDHQVVINIIPSERKEKQQKKK